MPPLHRLRRRLAFGMLLVTLPACRTIAPLALAPAVPVTSWRGVTATTELPPRGLVVTAFAVAEPPAGTPLSLAAAIISSDGGAPFRGRSRLPIGSLWLDDVATRTLLSYLQEAPAEAVQLLGETTTFVAADLCTTVEVPGDLLPRLELRLSWSGVEVRLLTPAATQTTPAEHARSPDDDGSEQLTIATRLDEDATAALFVPTSAAGAGGYLVALLPGPPPAHENVSAAQQRATATKTDADATPAPWQVAMQAVGEHNRRPALLALLDRGDLHRAIDVVLAADERGLIAITSSLAAIPDQQREQAWALERAVWQGLMPRIERDDLTPALRASLIRQLGALANDPATMSLLLGASVDGAAFAAALREENLVALDDRSAAARTFAFDWLRGNGIEVHGYDPLAEQAARRDALHNWHREHASAEEARR